MHKKYYRIPLFILLGIVAFFVAGFITMSLWNALLPELFHFPVITFWQTIGLLLLAKLFFGGLHGHGRRMRPGGHGRWNPSFEERLAELTPEEREKFKGLWKEYVCTSYGPWAAYKRHCHSKETETENEAK